jgi:hypothetical protein
MWSGGAGFTDSMFGLRRVDRLNIEVVAEVKPPQNLVVSKPRSRV